MKVVILAGGFGTRISEESHLKPKPMVEIGEKPILWHIMKYYSAFGFHDFIICCGYKQHVIKEWFADYYLHNSDVTFDLSTNKMEVHNNYSEPWRRPGSWGLRRPACCRRNRRTSSRAHFRSGWTPTSAPVRPPASPNSSRPASCKALMRTIPPIPSPQNPATPPTLTASSA